MGRPGLEVGTWGSISTRTVDGKWRARCRFRDYDGQVRYIVRYGPTEGKAETLLKVALRDRTSAPGAGELTRNTRLSALAAVWLAEVAESDLARSTKGRYSEVSAGLVVPGVGQLRLHELTVPAVDRFLKTVKVKNGAASAKSARSVLSGMIGLAVRHGAMATNPTRDTAPISTPRKVARALTVEEADELMASIRADAWAVELDLVDLCDFMLGTGVRLGEACALRVPQVDLVAGTVEVAATLTDAGIEERTKTAAGWRVLGIPPYVVELLCRRIEDPAIRTDVCLFPSAFGHVRDRSNLTGDLRRMFNRSGFDWVSSHVFRKTVATRLDDAGLSARQIADHLGHAQPSMTQDVYLGRRAANSEAAKILERG